MDPADDLRRRRAEARLHTTTLRRVALSAVETDTTPLCGPEAVSLVARLTRESWSLSGAAWPEYARADTPYRFVPWPR